MKSLFTFYFIIDYRSPSREVAFLNENWGLRDVRGPYMRGTLASIEVDSKLLMKDVSSSINFVLSVSNRCPVDSVLISIVNKKMSLTNYVNKNSSFDFNFDNIYRDSNDSTSFLVNSPELSSMPSLGKFVDIISIDEITIERSR